jgi:hypothetical protein
MRFDKFTEEYKDIASMKKIVDDKTYKKVVNEQEPFLFSI